MLARAPDRKLETYFLGAGFSRSVGLPNTAELLTEVHALAKREQLVIDEHLRAAYKYFYPEEAANFVPEVVDFFSDERAIVTTVVLLAESDDSTVGQLVDK